MIGMHSFEDEAEEEAGRFALRVVPHLVLALEQLLAKQDDHSMWQAKEALRLAEEARVNEGQVFGTTSPSGHYRYERWKKQPPQPPWPDCEKCHNYHAAAQPDQSRDGVFHFSCMCGHRWSWGS